MTYTYWVDDPDEHDGMTILFAQDEAGNIGQVEAPPLDDPDWIDALTKEWLAYPTDYILDLAYKAESGCLVDFPQPHK